MSDIAGTDVSDAADGVIGSPQPLRWTSAISQYYYNQLHAILSEDGEFITERELRERMSVVMMEECHIHIDSKQFAHRLRLARIAATEVQSSRIEHGELMARWEQRRDAFVDSQAERRQQRAERTMRRRSQAPLADSDEEFDEDEPEPAITALQSAQHKAVVAYDMVSERFSSEKTAQRKADTTMRRKERTEQKQLQRRHELINTMQSFAGEDLQNDDVVSNTSPSDSSSSSSSFAVLASAASAASASSSPSPSKRKFVPAAAIGAYTEYLARQSKQQTDIAAELREAIRQRQQEARLMAEATAEYRAAKLQSSGKYQTEMLALLNRDKENSNPNTN
jgi:hypothetical protein